MRANGAREFPGGTRAACAASHDLSPLLLATEVAIFPAFSCAATSRAIVVNVSSAAAPWGPSLAASSACPPEGSCRIKNPTHTFTTATPSTLFKWNVCHLM